MPSNSMKFLLYRSGVYLSFGHLWQTRSHLLTYKNRDQLIRNYLYNIIEHSHDAVSNETVLFAKLHFARIQFF